MQHEPISVLEGLGAAFQEELPHTRAPYVSRSWGHPFHSLCSYQGKLKPSLAHWLVSRFTSQGDRVLDPLGGVGTVAFEAALQGRTSFSCDLSPFASCVASAKLAPPAADQVDTELAAFIQELEGVELCEEDFRSAEFGLNASVREYYHTETLKEVLKAKRILNAGQLSAPRNFIKACLLHILHGNRPYALSRTSHPITPFSPSGDFEYKPVADKLRSRLKRLGTAEWPQEFKPGASWNSDFRALPQHIAEPVDAIICSPPFPGMRFDRPNWIRMWFCGWEAEDFHVRSRHFLERQQGKSFNVYDQFFEVCHELLRPNGPTVLHVGGSKAYDMATRLIAIAQPYFRHRGTISECVAHVEKHGIRDKGTTSSHLLLLFERI